AHVAEGRADAALGSHRVAARGKDLADAGSRQPRLGKTDGRAQPRATRAHHHHVERVVHESRGLRHALTPTATSATANTPAMASARCRMDDSPSRTARMPFPWT